MPLNFLPPSPGMASFHGFLLADERGGLACRSFSGRWQETIEMIVNKAKNLRKGRISVVVTCLQIAHRLLLAWGDSKAFYWWMIEVAQLFFRSPAGHRK
jgi:hypothetical protein